MLGIGATEVIIVAILILLFFGGKKIPELVKGITDSIREFRKASKEDDGKNND